MNLVIDASVALKWLLSESDSEKAEALLEACRRGAIVPMAPEILTVEVGNILWKRVMRGFLDVERAESLYAEFERIRPVLTPVVNLAGRALMLALKHRHSVYDCLYVALAFESRCELVTADEGLFTAFTPFHPRVRLLREWVA
jgi:predicted nucleic acid-binding protein